MASLAGGCLGFSSNTGPQSCCLMSRLRKTRSRSRSISTQTLTRRRSRGVTHGTGSDKTVALRLEGLTLTPVDNGEILQGDQKPQAAAHLEWLPDFDMVNHRTLFTPPRSIPAETRLQEEMTLLCIMKTLQRIQGLGPCGWHFEKFRDWLDLEVQRARDGTYPLLLPDEAKAYLELDSPTRYAMIEERCDHLLTMSKGAVATGIKRIYNSCEEIFTGSKDTLDTLVQGGVLTRIYDAVSFGKGDFFKLDGSLTLSVATEFRRCRVETTVYGLGDELPTDPEAMFATVSSQQKVDYLIKAFGIPKDHIFQSRDDSLATDLKRTTCNRGVDIFLKTVSSELLHAVWECVAGHAESAADIKKAISLASRRSRGVIHLTMVLRDSPGHSVERLRYAGPWISTGQVAMGLRDGEDLRDLSTRTNWRCDRRMGFYHNATASPATLGEAASVNFLARQVGAKVFSPMLKEDHEVVDRSGTFVATWTAACRCLAVSRRQYQCVPLRHWCSEALSGHGSSDTRQHAATSVARAADGTWQVTTPRSTVVAKEVVLATNVYTAALDPRFQGVVVPIHGDRSRLNGRG
ncbi:hypothetical protein MGG_00429 [Pyricularia oryzae 70-15]|uniref:Enoyl reductase (ER) domain-containing protein n=1 Tax=Pyricularia oryzae (strain 70-15 / ATCC MYA-4617 / FGSC 8958) TaxID=242507 RepID=G4NCA9_PYRO7|nr:uncharacterized protein MGG_00429 [Pyricularia oryzae 70-15]EHA49058.1 hypothetical protein MGG_00429 [Pyricularia oryzae 70-15]